MRFSRGTPTPQFRENSRESGARSLRKGSQRFDPPRGHSPFRGLKCRAAWFATGVAFQRHRPSGAAAGGGVPGAARSRLQAGVQGAGLGQQPSGAAGSGAAAAFRGAGAVAAQRGHVAGLFQGGVLSRGHCQGRHGAAFRGKTGQNAGLGAHPGGLFGGGWGRQRDPGRGGAGWRGAGSTAVCRGEKATQTPLPTGSRSGSPPGFSRTRYIGRPFSGRLFLSSKS